MEVYVFVQSPSIGHHDELPIRLWCSEQEELAVDLYNSKLHATFDYELPLNSFNLVGNSFPRRLRCAYPLVVSHRTMPYLTTLPLLFGVHKRGVSVSIPSWSVHIVTKTNLVPAFAFKKYVAYIQISIQAIHLYLNLQSKSYDISGHILHIGMISSSPHSESRLIPYMDPPCTYSWYPRNMAG